MATNTYLDIGALQHTSSGSANTSYRDIGAAQHQITAGGAYTLTATTAAFNISGSATGLRAARMLAAAVQTFSISPTATGLAVGRKLAATPQTYSLASSPVGLIAARKLLADAQAYTLSPTATSLRVARKLLADAQAYNLTGYDVTLTYTPAGGSPYTMVASPGSFSIAGVDVILRRALQLAATTGTFDVSGTATGLRVGRRLATTVGEFTITGFDVVLTSTGTPVDVDHSEYLFGEHADPLSTLSVDLHLRDDTSGDTLTIRISPSAAALSTLSTSMGG